MIREREREGERKGEREREREGEWRQREREREIECLIIRHVIINFVFPDLQTPSNKNTSSPGWMISARCLSFNNSTSIARLPVFSQI